MKLPKEIFPNPLVVTSIEIRFEAIDDDKDILSILYPVLIQNLPTFEPINRLPKEIKEANPELKFQPDFKLRNEQFSLSFGQNSLLFETFGTYPLWNSYFNFVATNFTEILKLNIIKNIIRIGVRYGSIFENAEISKTLKYYPRVEIPGFKEKIAHNRYDLFKGEYILHLQIAENAKLEKPDTTPRVGLYIDIDAYYNKTIKATDEVLRIIDSLHTTEKELFYTMLDDNFLKTLNPKY